MLEKYLHISLKISTFATLFNIMTTNAHILIINDRLCTVRNIVRSIPDGMHKQMMLTLLDDALDQLMETNTDISNATRKLAMLSDKVSALSRSIYEPVVSAQYTYPVNLNRNK